MCVPSDLEEIMLVDDFFLQTIQLYAAIDSADHVTKYNPLEPEWVLSWLESLTPFLLPPLTVSAPRACHVFTMLQ